MSSTVPKDVVQTSGASRTGLSPPPASPCGHSRWFVVHISDRHLSTFLRSLRSTGVTPFLRYYGRSDFVWGGSSAWKRHELRFIPQPISLLAALGFLTVLSPSICACPKAAGDFSNPLFGCQRVLLSRQTSPFLRRLAQSRRPYRVHVVSSSETLLRTGHSLPVALHPVLPRRSYSSIQHTFRCTEVDFHHSNQAPSQAHVGTRSIRVPNFSSRRLRG